MENRNVVWALFRLKTSTLQIDDDMSSSLQSPNHSQGREEKMSKITVDKKATSTNAGCSEAGAATCSFEGKFVSIAGSRLVVERDNDAKTTYALASNALMTCDGKIGKEETLKAGRRIRVTTQKGQSKHGDQHRMAQQEYKLSSNENSGREIVRRSSKSRQPLATGTGVIRITG